MAMLLVDLLLAVVSATAGFAGAWYLRRGSGSGNGAQKAQVAEMAIERLQDLTRRISADVVDHNSRVQEISDGLGNGKEVTSDTLTTAVASLISANEAMQNQLASAEKRLQDQAREIETHVAEARTDALTGLNNRRAFDTEMERGYAEFQRRGRPISCFIIDVDHFKSFNDTHGHQAGDEVLRCVARTLTRNSSPEHVVCRYGGEEFAIVFPGCTLSEAAPVAEKARRAIGEQVVNFEGKKLRVTASAGLAQLMPSEGIDELIRRADEALYASKEEGRNTAHGHDGELFFPLTNLIAATPQSAAANANAANEAVLELEEDPLPRPSGPKLPEERLVGLSNMKAFLEDLNRRLSESRRSGQPLCLIVARIDNYEEVQSQYGEKSATMVLRAAAQFFKASMRDMDHLAADEDDSFALMLPTATLENALKVAERLRGAVSRCKLPLGGRPLQFSMSLGVVEAAREDNGETLVQRGKAAQCQAKNAGGNQCYADALELEPIG